MLLYPSDIEALSGTLSDRLLAFERSDFDIFTFWDVQGWRLKVYLSLRHKWDSENYVHPKRTPLPVVDSTLTPCQSFTVFEVLRLSRVKRSFNSINTGMRQLPSFKNRIPWILRLVDSRHPNFVINNTHSFTITCVLLSWKVLVIV